MSKYETAANGEMKCVGACACVFVLLFVCLFVSFWAKNKTRAGNGIPALVKGMGKRWCRLEAAPQGIAVEEKRRAVWVEDAPPQSPLRHPPRALAFDRSAAGVWYVAYACVVYIRAVQRQDGRGKRFRCLGNTHTHAHIGKQSTHPWKDSLVCVNLNMINLRTHAQHTP